MNKFVTVLTDRIQLQALNFFFLSLKLYLVH